MSAAFHLHCHCVAFNERAHCPVTQKECLKRPSEARPETDSLLAAGATSLKQTNKSGGLAQAQTTQMTETWRWMQESVLAAGHNKERSWLVSGRSRLACCSLEKVDTRRLFWFHTLIILWQTIFQSWDFKHVTQLRDMTSDHPQSKQFTTHLTGKELLCHQGGNGDRLKTRWRTSFCSNPFE